MINITLKHAALILAGLYLSVGISFGQPDRKEKVEQLKIAFFTKELNLSSGEAEKFWPLYNEMSASIKKENKYQRGLVKEIRESEENGKEPDYQKLSNAILDSKIKEAQIQRDYHDKIGAVIGYKKATKLLSLEQRFKRELLNRVNHNRESNRPPRPGGPRSNQ